VTSQSQSRPGPAGATLVPGPRFEEIAFYLFIMIAPLTELVWLNSMSALVWKPLNSKSGHIAVADFGHFAKPKTFVQQCSSDVKLLKGATLENTQAFHFRGLHMVKILKLFEWNKNLNVMTVALVYCGVCYQVNVRATNSGTESVGQLVLLNFNELCVSMDDEYGVLPWVHECTSVK
jgi:hypothetical protein